MVKRTTLLIGFLFLISLISLVHAQQLYELGTFQRDTCVELKQTCANCTFVNVTSVIYPNSTEAFGMVEMTKTGTVYNYSFCDTPDIGQYIYWTIGDPDGVEVTAGVVFNITPTGNVLNSSESIIYIIIMIILLVLLALCLWGSITISWKNERNNYDEIIKVNWNKYLKMFCIGFSYVLLVWIIFLAWNLTYAFLSFDGIGNIFHIIYRILVGLFIPVCFTLGLLFLITYFGDRKIQKFLERGIPIT